MLGLAGLGLRITVPVLRPLWTQHRLVAEYQGVPSLQGGDVLHCRFALGSAGEQGACPQQLFLRGLLSVSQSRGLCVRREQSSGCSARRQSISRMGYT